jgi:hypothetical protein
MLHFILLWMIWNSKHQLLLDCCQVNTVTCMSDYRRGYGLDIGFIYHLQVVTANNYNIIAISTLYKIMLSYSVFSVFISSCLVTASNNGYFSSSGLKSV